MVRKSKPFQPSTNLPSSNFAIETPEKLACFPLE
jgi:hypothetical protein